MSIYSHNDIYLGFFNNYKDACDKKKEYIEYLKLNGDPYKEQLYFSVNLNNDIEIMEFDKNFNDSETIYCVIVYQEFLGQANISIIDITNNINECKNIIENEESLIDKNEEFTLIFMYFTMKINELNIVKDWGKPSKENPLGKGFLFIQL